MSTEEYVRNQRARLEARLGLSNVPGMDSKSLGVTDEDVVSNPPPKKRQKRENPRDVDHNEQWKLMFDEAPTFVPTETDWPLQWFYTRVRLGLGSKVWEQRHGAVCSIRALLRVRLKMSPSHPHFRSWLIDICLRLITVLALDRFGDFVSDSVIAPVRETAAQGLGLAAQLLEKEDVQTVIDHLSYLVQVGTRSTKNNSAAADADIWPIRHGGLLGLKWIFAVNQPLLEFNFPSLFSILSSSLRDRSDDCRLVAVSVLLPICEFICNDHLFRGIELAQLAWTLVRNGDDLTASTGSIINLLSSLMQFGRDELIYAVMGADASSVLPALLPLMLHSLRGVREAAMESISSILECTGTHNLDAVLQDTLNRSFYISLIEPPDSRLSKAGQATWCHAVKMASPELLGSICEANLSLWVVLASAPDGHPLDPALVSMLRDQSPTDELFWLGGATDAASRKEVYPQTRYVLCHLLSELFVSLGDTALHAELGGLLSSTEGYKRLVGCSIIFLLKRKNFDVERFLSHIEDIHSKDVVYMELRRPLTALQLSMKKLAATIDMRVESIFNAVQAREFIEKSFPVNQRTEEQHSLCGIVEQNIVTLETMQYNLNSSIRAFTGSILLFCGKLPEKLNPLIKPLLESTKFCSNSFTRDILASAFCSLLDQVQTRNPNLPQKLVKTFITFTTHQFQPGKSPFDGFNQDQIAYFLSTGLSASEPVHAIMTLLQLQGALVLTKPKKKDEAEALRRSPPPFAQYKCESASHILSSLILYYNQNLPNHLAPLWNEMISLRPLQHLEDVTINRLCLLLHCGAKVLCIEPLREKFIPILSPLVAYLSAQNPHVRHCVSQIVATLAEQSPGIIIERILDDVLNSMASDNVFARKGAVELVYLVIKQLADKVIAFTVLFIVPILRLMSDRDQPVRQLSALTFGKLIQLMPLEAAIKSPESDISQRLAQRRDADRRFLEQLFDNSKCEAHAIKVDVKAELRDYQREGVNWLMFLNRFGLHGILSDEMGLGKTLQTIVAVASDHYNRSVSGQPNLPTLIVSPPSVTGHWVEEIGKFCPSQLQVLHYTGNNKERQKLQQTKSNDYNVLVTSYEVVRNDVAFFQGIQWNYIVLDEGHVIRNTKTKVSQSIRSLCAKHRMILSGTPIQNSATELWSLFDFLMPGFLGSEKQFYHQYGKAIQNSRDAKSSGKDHEAGILALKALHRQCLPFMLRRQKSDVLADLPPKIIQDYCCDLSPLQKMLYEDFAKTRAKKSIESSLESSLASGGDDKSEKIGHIFQAIQYLQKLCNHPSLVLTRQHPEYEKVTKELRKRKSSIMDIEHAPKFKALMQLLNDCGIGSTDKVVSEHRALIFCQHKSIIDLIEKELFKSKMPTVSYMRLDGSVPPGSRHAIVSKFNHDPSIDVLLLTTKVGGLGLNLTGADVVIFMEHDWNPQMDLQAMDRAHRIGQKKTVNVYRLITRNTVEEKIMSLQRFKLNIANTVVSTDNSSMNTMSTGQILDLFSLQSSDNTDKKRKPEKSGTGINLVNELGELWDEREYDEEFKVNQFLEKLKN